MSGWSLALLRAAVGGFHSFSGNICPRRQGLGGKEWVESFGGKPLYVLRCVKKKQLIIDKLLPIMVGSCDGSSIRH